MSSGTPTAARSSRPSARAGRRRGGHDDARRLGEALGRLVRALRRASAGPLGPSALSTLATVARSGPVRLGELAEREGVAPATLSRVVALLESQGLVDRAVDPADRRAAFLTATDAGHDTFEAMMAARAELLAARMARLSPADRATLAAAVDVIEQLAAD